MKIKGGYYIKARAIQNSEIATAPPHVREIWDWLLKESNHADKKYGGKIIKRGQCVRSYSDIIEGLKWYVGYRKMTYSKANCETAMKWLKKHAMITTTKTTKGMVITICNYNKYQDPKNYETYKKATAKTTTEPQPDDSINKNENINPDSDESGTPEFYKTKKGRKLTGKRLESFNLFWESFSFRKGKADAADSWHDIPQLTDKLVLIICEAAKKEAINRVKILESGGTPKWAQGWLTSRRWEDEDLIDDEKPKEKIYVC